MADDKPQDSPEKKDMSSDKKLFIGLIGLFVVLGIAYAISLGPVETPVVAEVLEDDIKEIEQAYGEPSAAAEEEASAPLEAGVTSQDVSSMSKERILGDRSAPIKISEHSSFSCGHCAKFHAETLPAFKEAYIDTGKAYMVFSDFPLNAPALHATLTARCVPEDRYLEFVEKLFAEQNDWAFERNYLQLLEKRAGEYGLDSQAFKDCIRNEDLQDALLGKMKAVQQKWQVQSTPSFVVNNQKLVQGALPYADFEQAILDAVAAIEAEQNPEVPQNIEPSGVDEGE